MVVLHEDGEKKVIANNGFVWIEYRSGHEYTCDDDEADEWWVEYKARHSWDG